MEKSKKPKSKKRSGNMVTSTAIGIIRVMVGFVILAYVGYCLVNQKVWLRGPVGLTSKNFSWGVRDGNETIFLIHVIVGALVGLFLVLSNLM